MIRIVVADDHTIVREGLKQVLAAATDLEIVGEAQTGHALKMQQMDEAARAKAQAAKMQPKAKSN